MKRIIEVNGKKYKAINEAPNIDIVRQWEMTEMDFISGIRKIKQMMDKTTGSRTSSRILDKAFGKQVSPLMDKLTKLINDLSATNK
jgi:predicted double-glycine peptidase|tara:strand:+ start:817 stop:1074 length:258 start_codon:yes stop_codon:yes gene_type:complete